MLQGLWHSAGAGLYTPGKKPFRLGKLSYVLPGGVLAGVSFSGRAARVALRGQHLALVGQLGGQRKALVYLTARRRAARGVLYLAAGLAVTPRRMRRDKLEVGVSVYGFRPARGRLRLRLGCGELTLRGGRVPKRSASWPDGAARRARGYLKARSKRARIAVYRAPGRGLAGYLTSGGAVVDVLESKGKHLRIRYRGTRYAVVGWVLGARVARSVRKHSVGGLLSGLGVGRLGGKPRPRVRCRQRVPLFARRGARVRGIGWVLPQTRMRLRPVGGSVKGFSDVEVVGVKWLYLARGVSLALRARDLKAHCR